MLIVHRLLENFNQEVNKFVDLESHQINFYSNKDLPPNIFEDLDHWFYERSPEEWYFICKNQNMNISKALKDKMLSAITSMYENVTEINQIRFDAEDFILENNLNEQINQDSIYKILEKGVSLFESFYLNQKKLIAAVYQYKFENKIADKSPQLYKTHNLAIKMLEELRYKNDNEWQESLDELNKEIRLLNANGEKFSKLELLAKDADDFISTGAVALEYKLYGKYYYYHNSRFLNHSNRYGNGYVNSYNEKINSTTTFKLFEIPHFYQVIYPTKILENIPLVSSDPIIDKIPEKLREREIIVSDRTIEVDSQIVNLMLYDHKMIDGDIVSVNFNGDWILEEYELKGKPYNLQIKLNKEGKNYLLLHALNLGSRPPNTMALKYMYRGKEESVVLSSNLNESEVIEIKIVQ